MGDFTLLAANCFVPCNKVDMELTINTIKRMPGFLRLKQFDELEKNKHAPEDDEHIWVCAVYKVRDEEVATIIRVLRALPYCQTLWLPDNAFVKDEMLELRHHPRFQGGDNGHSSDDHADDDVASGSGDTAGPSGSAGRSTAERSSGAGSNSLSDDSKTNDTDEDEVMYIGKRTLKRPLTQTEAEEPSFLERLQARMPVAQAAPPPKNVPHFLADIIGPWRRFTGHGDTSARDVNLPPRAHFTALSTIDSLDNRSSAEFYTNVVGMVDTISVLTVTNTEPHWRIEIVDTANPNDRIPVYLFPANHLNLPLGSELPGIKAGDLLTALNVCVPADRMFVGVRWDSTLFLAENLAESCIAKVDVVV